MPEDRCGDVIGFEYPHGPTHAPYVRQLGYAAAPPSPTSKAAPWFSAVAAAARRPNAATIVGAEERSSCGGGGVVANGGVATGPPTPAACKTYQRSALRAFNAAETLAPPAGGCAHPLAPQTLVYGRPEYRHPNAAPWCAPSRWRRDAYASAYSQPQFRAAAAAAVKYGEGRRGDGVKVASTSDDAVSECRAAGSGEHGRTNAENFLPRIIKPRKRKKKDRKPNAATDGSSLSPSTMATTTLSQQPQSARRGGGGGGGDVVALPNGVFASSRTFLAQIAPSKPEQRRVDSRPLPAVDVSSSRRFSGEPTAAATATAETTAMAALPPLSDEAIAALLAATVAEERADDESEAGAAAAVFCNCRYCDPQGVVWDVKEKRYSVNLMPPSMPSSGEIGGGGGSGIVVGSYGAASAPNRSVVVDDDAARSPSKTDSTAQNNLQVSSQIVTSLNGHRDIEIKFYSSSNEKT